MQDRADGKLNGFVGAPVDRLLDAAVGARQVSRVNVSALMITDTL
jgi:hypothetical protein